MVRNLSVFVLSCTFKTNVLFNITLSLSIPNSIQSVDPSYAALNPSVADI
jgi:hypothetical protein